MTTPRPTGGFVPVESPAEVAVVSVTYNSTAELPGFLDSLRAEAADAAIRVVIADNSPSPETLELLAGHSDVISVTTGGNLGYAAGINVAMEHIGEVPAVLVLNPDLRVRPGAVRRLLDFWKAHPNAGVVAPMIVDDDGRLTPSQFNEPTALRAWSDALLGPIWRSRPAPLTEWVRSPDAYRQPRRADWVSGAALLIPRRVAEEVGEWDERFFLYSEETDYCRRVRDAGYEIWFDPSGTVEHSQGKSGSSPKQSALQAVNRVRYMQKHHPYRAESLRRGTALGERLRSRGSIDHRTSYEFLRAPHRWRELPRATWRGTGRQEITMIIPAHDEAAVIGRTLAGLADPVDSGALDLIVACNGCTDDTAAVASSHPGVRVLDLPTPSKTAALNAADGEASVGSRIFVDADVEFPAAALPGIRRALAAPGVLAARPAFRYDTSSSSVLVRAYYRARFRIPAMSEALWGAGAYAVSATGRDRVLPFPGLVADDLHADRAFTAAEKRFPPTPPVIVHPPRSTAALLAILGRVRRGADEQGVDTGGSTGRALLRTVRGPFSLFDAVVYAVLTLRARVRGRRSGSAPKTWERDDSSRS